MEGLCEVKKEIGELKEDVAHLKTEVTELKEDVAHLKTEVTEMKEDVAHLKTEVTELKEDVAHLKTEVTELKEDVTELKSDMKLIKLQIENEIRHNIAIVAEGHMDLARNVKNALTSFAKLEEMGVRINYYETEIRAIRDRMNRGPIFA